MLLVRTFIPKGENEETDATKWCENRQKKAFNFPKTIETDTNDGISDVSKVSGKTRFRLRTAN